MYTSFKKELFTLFMTNFVEVFITIDTSNPTLSCPEVLKIDKLVTLNVGERAISYYDVHDTMLELKIRISGMEQICYIPWNSIVNITTENFVFAQTKEIESIDNKVTNQIKVEQEDTWITKETKYPHLKLYTKRIT